MNRFALPLLLLAFLLANSATAQPVETPYGNVDFTPSCTEEAQQHFHTGLALLHHMMYEQAEAHFADAADADPSCAMAHWGIAMSVIHPLWGEAPTEDNFQKGARALEQASSPLTEREQAYLEAVAAFYQADRYPDQLAAFEEGWAQVHEAYPDDVEAAAFYALSHLATAPPDDGSFSHQQTAGALLESWRERRPEHPGLFHYTIHAYDNPALADRAVDVARGYDALAPNVPHALHMPSHIFVRLGMWPEVVSWNERSAEAAWEQPVGDYTSMHHAHALDYLIYAYLQQGQDGEAQRILNEMRQVDNYQPTFATAYALAAIPARYALERGQWDQAAALPLREPDTFPWERYPGAEALLHFARGLGAARSGDHEAARSAIASLQEDHRRLTEAGEPYWATLVEAQQKAVEAWLALDEDRTEEALALMREAADLEDSVDKHPVTPSAPMPARELLGEMLLMTGTPSEALTAFEEALAISPGRFHSLYGAARAADRMGDTEQARHYYTELLEGAASAEAPRPQLAEAEAYLQD